LILTFLLLQSGCGSARRGEPFAPAFQADSAELATGERVFMQYCHQCHPGGETGIGPAINNKPLPTFLMKLQIRRGLGAMPAFPERVINEEDLTSLVHYLKTLRRHPGYPGYSRPPQDV
jgi:mono/diheme cytochrome c family protein